MKYRSRALGQGACLKGMSRTITMQGFTVTAITNAETRTLLRSISASGKVNRPWNIAQGHRVKVCAWRVCQGQLLCKVSDSQLSLMSRKPNFDVKIFKVSGLWKIGQGHQVKVCAWRVCQGQLLCKVSDSQLSLMSRKPNFNVNVDKTST